MIEKNQSLKNIVNLNFENLNFIESFFLQSFFINKFKNTSKTFIMVAFIIPDKDNLKRLFQQYQNHLTLF